MHHHFVFFFSYRIVNCINKKKKAKDCIKYTGCINRCIRTQTKNRKSSKKLLRAHLEPTQSKILIKAIYLSNYCLRKVYLSNYCSLPFILTGFLSGHPQFSKKKITVFLCQLKLLCSKLEQIFAQNKIKCILIFFFTSCLSILSSFYRLTKQESVYLTFKGQNPHPK